jgi:hypothetical protein
MLLSVCVSLYSPIISRQRPGKSPRIVARQWLRKNVTAVTNTHAIEELFDSSFSMWPVSYQGTYAISSSQNFFFNLGLFNGVFGVVDCTIERAISE